MIIKTIRFSLATILIATNCVLVHATETNYWASRRLAKLPASLQTNVPSIPVARSVAPHVPKVVAPLIQSLPHSLANINEVALPTNIQPKKIILHIQDVHRNSEAQKNISKIIQTLLQDNKVHLLALEGAFDPINFDDYRQFKFKDSLRYAADQLLSRFEISGPIHAAMISPAALPPIVGVDDQQAYQANVDAYLHSKPNQKDLTSRIQNEQLALSQSKGSFLNPSLKKFDASVDSYHNGDLSFAQYLSFLIKETGESPFSIESFLTAHKMEPNLNFDRIKNEKTRLLNHLIRKLNQQELDQLTQQSLAYRSKQVSPAQFFGAFKDMCEAKKINMASYPHLSDYIQYLLLSDSIKPNDLFDQMAQLEDKGYKAHIQTSIEKKIIRDSKRLHLKEKLAQFSLTPREWEEFTIAPSQSDVLSFKEFYRQAEIRDEKITANLLKAMEKHKARVAILVAGGFHSPGINRLLRKQNIGVVTLSPKITEIKDEDGTHYLSAFAQEKSPVETLFEGKKLFLAQSPAPISARLKGIFIAADHHVRSGLQETIAALAYVRYWITSQLRGPVMAYSMSNGASTIDVRILGYQAFRALVFEGNARLQPLKEEIANENRVFYRSVYVPFLTSEAWKLPIPPLLLLGLSSFINPVLLILVGGILSVLWMKHTSPAEHQMDRIIDFATRSLGVAVIFTIAYFIAPLIPILPTAVSVFPITMALHGLYNYFAPERFQLTADENKEEEEKEQPDPQTDRTGEFIPETPADEPPGGQTDQGTPSERTGKWDPSFIDGDQIGKINPRLLATGAYTPGSDSGNSGYTVHAQGGTTITNIPPEELQNLTPFNDKYGIRSEIGRGGMGVVYLAADLTLERWVALKVWQVDDSEGAKDRKAKILQIMQEAKALAKVEHEAVVHVNQVGIKRARNGNGENGGNGEKGDSSGETGLHFEEGDVPFIDMELILGHGLNNYMRGGEFGDSLTLEEKVSIIRRVVEGFVHVHKQGILHRDIKPSNIMLLKDNKKPKIVDFGLAMHEDEASTGLAGTPNYMSPEQTQGLPLDNRSDIFSLGSTMYELFSGGNLPFANGSLTNTFRAIMNDKQADLRDPRFGLPNELVDIIDKMLEKNPKDRYQRMEDVLKDLIEIEEELQRIKLEAKHESKQIKRWYTNTRSPLFWLIAIPVLLIIIPLIWFISMRAYLGYWPILQEPIAASVPGEDIGKGNNGNGTQRKRVFINRPTQKVVESRSLSHTLNANMFKMDKRYLETVPENNDEKPKKTYYFERTREGEAAKVVRLINSNNYVQFNFAINSKTRGKIPPFIVGFDRGYSQQGNLPYSLKDTRRFGIQFLIVPPENYETGNQTGKAYPLQVIEKGGERLIVPIPGKVYDVPFGVHETNGGTTLNVYVPTRGIDRDALINEVSPPDSIAKLPGIQNGNIKEHVVGFVGFVEAHFMPDSRIDPGLFPVPLPQTDYEMVAGAYIFFKDEPRLVPFEPAPFRKQENKNEKKKEGGMPKGALSIALPGLSTMGMDGSGVFSLFVLGVLAVILIAFLINKIQKWRAKNKISKQSEPVTVHVNDFKEEVKSPEKTRVDGKPHQPLSRILRSLSLRFITRSKA